MTNVALKFTNQVVIRLLVPMPFIFADFRPLLAHSEPPLGVSITSSARSRLWLMAIPTALTMPITITKRRAKSTAYSAMSWPPSLHNRVNHNRGALCCIRCLHWPSTVGEIYALVWGVPANARGLILVDALVEDVSTGHSSRQHRWPHPHRP